MPGSHSLIVRLTDDQGATTDRVIDGERPPAPTVQILTPADHSTVLAGDLIAFTASASSPGGSITRVVYSDITDYPIEIGDGIGTNYLFNWTPGSVGFRRLPRLLMIAPEPQRLPCRLRLKCSRPDNLPSPSSSPNDGSSVYLGQTIAVQADASAMPPGQVVEVDFYDGSRYLGSSYRRPLSTNWTPGALGSHTLTAEVYDSFNQYAATSISVNVIVAPPLTVSFLQPLAGSYLQVSQPTTLVASIENIVGTLNSIQFYVNGNLSATACRRLRLGRHPRSATIS